MRRQLFPALRILLLLSLVLGVLYPLAALAVGQLAFAGKADGSLLHANGKAVGSRLIGQPFTQPRYFHPRPSNAGTGYDATASAASNLGPTSDKLLARCFPTTDADGNDVKNPDGTPVCSDATVPARVDAYRDENGLPGDAKVPVDAVTSSGSGLDPHISVANARLQSARVAKVRAIQAAEVLRLIDANTDGRSLGFLGEPGVNVLTLNLALDRLAVSRAAPD